MIPPGPRPPNHYVLLGLPPFSSSVPQIEEAASRQLERLDRYALHPEVSTRESCQRMMNEVAKARVILVSAEKRRAYDDELMRQGFQLPEAAKPADEVERGARGVAEVLDHPEAAEEPHEQEASAESAHADAQPADAADEHHDSDPHPELAFAAHQASRVIPLKRQQHPNRGVAFGVAAVVIAASGMAFFALRYFHAGTPKAAAIDTSPTTDLAVAPMSQPDTQPASTQVAAVAPIPVNPPVSNHVAPVVAPKPPPSPVTPATETVSAVPENKQPDFFGVRGTTDSQPAAPAPVSPKITSPVAPPQTAPVVAPKVVVPVTVPAVVRAGKMVMPDEDQYQTAARAVDQAYRDELAAAVDMDSTVALARRILQAAADQKGDPAGRYALYIKARDVALQAGDASTAMAAVRQLEDGFSINGIKMKSDVLMAAVTRVKNADQQRALAREAVPIIDEALYLDRYDLARPVAEAALAAARQSNDWATARDVVVRVLEIRGGIVAYSNFQKAIATLQVTPDDPAANLTAGLYACLWKNRWNQGLQMLAQGDDPQLKDMALREMSMPADAAAQLKLADDWWAYGQKQESIPQQKIRGHAGVWYRKAAPAMTGADRDRADRRVAAIGRMALPDDGVDVEPRGGAAVPLSALTTTLATGTAASIVPAPGNQSNVAAMPSADDQKAAFKQVAVLADGLVVEAGTSPRNALAEHIWRAAAAALSAGKSDPNALSLQYTLLLESVRLGAETGNLGIISQAADQMEKHFAVDATDLKFQALSCGKAENEQELKNLIDGACELRDDAMERQEFATAFKFAILAEALAGRSTDPNRAAAIHTANAPLSDWPTVQAAFGVLGSSPTDKDANKVVGQFLCFAAGNWKIGLNSLARCGDANLKALAGRELKNPASAEDQQALADGWWGLAAKNPTGPMQLEWHAAQWYYKALPNLPTSAQSIVAARIQNLNMYGAQLPAIGDPQVTVDPRMPATAARALLTLYTGAGMGNYVASFTPDGSHILALGSDRFWLWDGTTGDPVSPPTVVCEPPQTPQIRAIFLDGSGTRVVAVGGDGKSITVWDVAKQKQIGVAISLDDLVDADISPDGRTVITAGGSSTARLWDLRTGQRVGTEMQAGQRLTAVRFSGDGKYVLTASADRSCQIWSALDGSPVSRLEAPRAGDFPQVALFSPSSKSVGLLFHDGAAATWETTSGRCSGQFDIGTLGQVMAFSPNGLYMAGGGNNRYRFSHSGPTAAAFQVFELSTGKTLTGLLKQDGGGKDMNAGLSMSFSHDSRYLVTSSPLGRTARVWDIGRGGALAVAPLEHLQTVTSAGFDLPGRHVVTACADGSIRVWELPG
jgi:hypothetical protein